MLMVTSKDKFLNQFSLLVEKLTNYISNALTRILHSDYVFHDLIELFLVYEYCEFVSLGMLIFFNFEQFYTFNMLTIFI
ncbi:hypothetical protein KUTeg_019757 [Tegillarca granosa]|uniref:Uncharacterized protein n=1 Tax=Tegillarca granosa TaxID=220873 RepID=A0ABQ9EG12_TEGGR|nr:hypothetical protein KUTeg_019757 [Tegillarca granosa]